MSTEEHKRQEGARTKAVTAGTVQDGKVGGDWKFQKDPVFLKERLAIWDELHAKQEEVYKGKCAINQKHAHPIFYRL